MSIIPSSDSFKYSPDYDFKFDLKLKTGFVRINFIATVTLNQNLLTELKDTFGDLCEDILYTTGISKLDYLSLLASGFVTGEIFQVILNNKRFTNSQTRELHRQWNKLAANITIANMLGYQTYTQLQPEKRAEVLIGNSNDFLYQRAFYKTKLNTAWNYFYGRDLINMIEDPNTGEKTMLPGDGYPLYKIFVEGLGETFKQYYDKVNPRVENLRFRQYTYSQVMYKHTLLTRALNSYVDKLQIIMLEISLNEGLNHPNLTEETLNKRRVAARKILYKRIDGMSTIADLVEFFDKQDEERSNQNFFLAS